MAEKKSWYEQFTSSGIMPKEGEGGILGGIWGTAKDFMGGIYDMVPER